MSRFSGFCWFLLPCSGGMRCVQGSSPLLLSVKCCKTQALISQSKVSVFSLVWGFNACKSIFRSPAVCFKIFQSTVVLQSFGKGIDSVKLMLLVLARRWVLNETETRQSPWGLLSLRRDFYLCLVWCRGTLVYGALESCGSSSHPSSEPGSAGLWSPGFVDWRLKLQYVLSTDARKN